MSFDPTSKKDKAQLYQVLKTIAKLSYGDTVDLLIDKAVGQPVPHGDNWQRNYRRGEYDSAIAQIIYRWVEKHHFADAHQVAPDIFPDTPERQWGKILDERATPDGFKLELVTDGFGVVQRRSRLQEVQQVIKWGQSFCLTLNAASDGYALALQGRGDHWDVIELGENGSATVPIQQGINHLPKDANGEIDPLSENSDEGITDFVMIVAATDRIPQEVARLIILVNESECEVFRKVVCLKR